MSSGPCVVDPRANPGIVHRFRPIVSQLATVFMKKKLTINVFPKNPYFYVKNLIRMLRPDIL